MKACIKCGLEKTTDLFPKATNRPDGLYNYCKECHNNTGRKRFAKQLLEYKNLIAEMGCAVCGFNHPNALEVHHLHKSYKRYGRSQGHRPNLEDLEAGVAILLCANCHGIFHGHFGGKNAPFPVQTIDEVCHIIKHELTGCA